MWFLDNIVRWLEDASGFFYDAYLEVRDWIWPFHHLDEPLYYLSSAFINLAYYFGEFNEWVEDAADKVVNILTFGDIWSYFQWWFDRAEWAWDWVKHATWEIWYEIDDWWSSTRLTVLDWISDVETWTQSQLNSLQSTFNTLITDVESWTTTQLNNAQNTLTALITELDLWTSTQLNNLQATFTTLIGNVEAWTVTQIDNVKSAILAVIGDLETWTITEINTITAALSALIDWPALTAWITTWWNERLLGVESLINSTLLTWFPFYDDLVSLWDEIKLFFTNPLDWLEEKFTDWFLGAE